MGYYRVNPHPILQQVVQCFWALTETAADKSVMELMPDPFVEVVINCGAPYVWQIDDGRWIEVPRIFLSGLQIKPCRIQALGPVHAIFMRMYPWGAPAIVGTPANNASIVALEDKEWRDIAVVVEKAMKLSGHEAAILRLQEFVIGLYSRKRDESLLLHPVGKLMFSLNGQIPMSELAASCYLSASQFDRQFKRFTKITPKTYARIIRFQAICQRLLDNPSHQMSALAQDFGYTDQAHLTHDFKSFAQRTPLEYISYLRSNTHLLQDAEFLQDFLSRLLL